MRGNGSVRCLACRVRSARGAARRRERAAPPVPVAALRRVALPDLSHASPSVQDQLREGHAVLTRSIETAGIRPADLGDAYGRMGMLLMAAEYRDEAESAYLNAQALSPNEARWPYYLGHLYKIKGDTPKSAAAFERARVLRPDDVPTLVWLGDAFSIKAKPEAAQLLFAKALSLQPRLVAAQFGLGRAALARQDYARAVDYLERALTLDPKATIVHYPLALAYRGMGDTARAEAHMRQRGTLQIKPDDPLLHELDTLLRSALAYEVSGADALDKADWDGAAENFRKGIALAPNEPSLHHKLGTALFLKGDAKGAVDQFEEALRLSPAFAKRTTAWASSWRRVASRRRRSITGWPPSRLSPATSRRAFSWRMRSGEAGSWRHPSSTTTTSSGTTLACPRRDSGMRRRSSAFADTPRRAIGLPRR